METAFACSALTSWAAVPLGAAERVSGALVACLCAGRRLCAVKVTAKATVSALKS